MPDADASDQQDFLTPEDGTLLAPIVDTPSRVVQPSQPRKIVLRAVDSDKRPADFSPPRISEPKRQRRSLDDEDESDLSELDDELVSMPPPKQLAGVQPSLNAPDTESSASTETGKGGKAGKGGRGGKGASKSGIRQYNRTVVYAASLGPSAGLEAGRVPTRHKQRPITMVCRLFR